MQRYQRQFKALGSETILTAVSGWEESKINSVFENLRTTIKQFEQQFSRFLPDSELTHFNQLAGQKVTISPEFHNLLTSAKAFSTTTNDLYNPFILPALQQAGYVGSWPMPKNAKAGTTYEKRHMVSGSQIDIGENWAKIPADTALDFGGIGKGYLLDRLSEFLDSQKMGNYWLSLGGDIICNGHDVHSEAWEIGISDAIDPAKAIDTITNHGNKLAIATSGITKRQGMHHNKAWHHLIDPRTLLPANTDILTATLTASTAATADVYAKCVVILGSQHASAYLTANRIDNYLLQLTSGQTIKSLQ